MVRVYSRKTLRQSWSSAAMADAVEAVREGRLGYKSASKTFLVPRSTLRDRVKNRNKWAHGADKAYGRPTSLSTEIEEMLCLHILKLEEMMFGITADDVRVLAFQLAVRNGIPNPFPKGGGKAGYDWLQGFLKRHPQISVRQPEATSAARARGFNRASVTTFYSLLAQLLDKYHYPATNIWNVDETNISAVQTKPSKILARKGKKQVGALTSAERGKLVSVVISMSAAGNFVPPMVIWPRVRMQPVLMEGTPPGSISAATPSGWMQTDLFVDWFKHFLKRSNASLANPTLLILDGHSTHTQNLNLIDLAREHGVQILCLPPHCTHRLQPLDVTFMKPLSLFYDECVRKWLRNHPGRLVSMFQIGALFGEAYVRAATMQNALSGIQMYWHMSI